MKKLTLLDIKQSLRDERFRELFPELQKELDTFIKNPGCPCNTSLYKSLFSYKDRLRKYFPTKEIDDTEIDKPIRNSFTVINCHKDDLEKRLTALKPGRKQYSVARYEDQITMVVVEVD